MCKFYIIQKQNNMKGIECKNDKIHKQVLKYLYNDTTMSEIKKIVHSVTMDSLDLKISEKCELIINKELKKMFEKISHSIQTNTLSSNLGRQDAAVQYQKVSGKFYKTPKINSQKQENKEKTCNNCGKNYKKVKQKQNTKNEIYKQSSLIQKVNQESQLRKIKSLTKILSEQQHNNTSKTKNQTQKNTFLQSSHKLIKSISQKQLPKINNSKINQKKKQYHHKNVYQSVNLAIINQPKQYDTLLQQIKDHKVSAFYQVAVVNQKSQAYDHFSDKSNNIYHKNKVQVDKSLQKYNTVLLSQGLFDNSFFSEKNKPEEIPTIKKKYKKANQGQQIWENNLSVDLHDQKHKSTREKNQIYYEMIQMFECKTQIQKQAIKKFIKKYRKLSNRELIELYRKKNVN